MSCKPASVRTYTYGVLIVYPPYVYVLSATLLRMTIHTRKHTHTHT